MSLDLQIAQLRHAYAHLQAGAVKDQRGFARGLLGPVIAALEAELFAAAMNATRAATPGAVPAELVELSRKQDEHGGEWFVSHAYTEDGLSAIVDGRQHGMFPLKGEVPEVELACAAVNHVRQQIALAAAPAYPAAAEAQGGAGAGMEEIERLRIPGVDGQVLVAAREASEELKQQPQWLWHNKELGSVTYGRWAKNANGPHAPYIRADLLLTAIRNAITPPAAERPDGAAGVREAAFQSVSEYAHALQVALTNLAGGGSENFVRHDDEFRADIPRCVAKVQDRLARANERWKEAVRALKTPSSPRPDATPSLPAQGECTPRKSDAIKPVASDA